MRVLTWNVLHRTHGETHGEKACLRWPVEAERIEQVAMQLVAAARVCEVVLLQEVSGDLLVALRQALPRFPVLAHAFPRIPRPRTGPDGLVDRTEYLAVVAPPGSTVRQAHTFSGDPGKGFLRVRTPGGIDVLSTHVSWGARRGPQLAELGQLLAAATDPLVIGGDFNASWSVVAEGLGGHPVFARRPDGSPPTRPHADPREGGDIDHLVASRGSWSEVTALDHKELSDHLPVAATYAP